ncbi:uncharacterized protein FOMMEDRAFT_19732 [Fomitiporia mediterranea MF3/22]|uniref:uncharacterized protein n=1 Tax=Fomitiporia mediterranea (strain MF3/22) TaxID=694068 RepID=UPI0004408D25|nr:uncharacterized protein FOMMEDRAFT_19732 [Fomitiporia mediterranea MF3/22]EJD04524.1 hypothetical protein FOMMEDRAFT_19732 [Fomitiporia mediterranea MF3/22]
MDDQADEDAEQVHQDWEWDWQRQQHREGLERRADVNDRYSPQHTSSPTLDADGAYAQNTSAADWVTDASHRSAHSIAEKACEMVCYLWFSSSLGPRGAAASHSRRERELSQRRRRDGGSAHSPPFASRPLSNASTAALQFCASPEFVQFMAKLLATTQVSQSVIVLSLHYIYRLKERNDFTLGKPGSEFRVAVCALMLANKFVDDNTYTNKTWSDVSAIPLDELNKMEREFLLGVGFCLFVDEATYGSWLNLLRGLVLAKEREYNRWREGRRARPIAPCAGISNAKEPIRIEVQQHQQPPQQRARSTSPRQLRGYAYAPAYPFTFTVPSSSTAYLQTVPQSDSQTHSSSTSPNRPVSSKRTAADAFSPISATFAGASRGGKRSTGLALDIPAALASASSSNATQKVWERAGSVSAQPSYTYADSLRRLENMSLATPVEQRARNESTDQVIAEEGIRERAEQTLAAPYRVSDAARRALPPHLYFYALASSPLRSPYAAYTTSQVAGSNNATADGNSLVEEQSAAGESSYLPPGAERKARLRYVDSRANDWYGYQSDTSRYHHTVAQGQSQAQPSYTAYPQHGAFTIPQVVVPPTTSSSNEYSQPQLSTHQSTAVAHSPHPQLEPMQRHQQGQHLQHLPPLALALSMPPAPRPLISQTQSACASPLPSFASLDAYAPSPAPVQEYTHVHSQPWEDAKHGQQHLTALHPVTVPQDSNAAANLGPALICTPPSTLTPAPVAQSSWSAPASEMIDGVYAPSQRHVHLHPRSIPPINSQTFHYQHPEQSRPVASAIHRAQMLSPYVYAAQSDQREPASSSHIAVPAYSSHSQTLPERAAFANAGPPGVMHFYAYAHSDATRSAHDTSSAINDSVIPRVVQQSQSVTASPDALYGYGYATRGRRL